MSKTLAFEFKRKRYDGAVSQLPFIFGGEANDNGGDSGGVVDGNSVTLALCFVSEIGNPETISTCKSQRFGAIEPVSVCKAQSVHVAEQLTHCESSSVEALSLFSKCNASTVDRAEQINQCSASVRNGIDVLSPCFGTEYGKAETLSQCSSINHSGIQLEQCSASEYATAKALTQCSSAQHAGEQIANCIGSIVPDGVPIECEHYEIPEPEPKHDKPEWACGRPSAHKLSLTFNRREKHEPASLLSFLFACSDDKTTIPTKTTYMYTPEITAEHNGNPINLIAPRFSRDDTQHAWRGSVDVLPDTFNALQFPNPEITITINGVAWVFVAEKTGARLVFGEERYTLKLTSLSCLLDSPRFIPRSNEYIDTNGRQIINKELYGTSFEVGDWELPVLTDWIIPKLVYENQTPMQVIGELVSQIGGCVECDRIERKIHIRSRWKVSAWNVNTEAPDVELNDVIREISDTPNVTQRCTQAQILCEPSAQLATVKRQATSDIIEHDLMVREYAVGQSAQVHAVTQALGDTGDHCEHQVITELYPEENINLAGFGEIWRVHDPRGHWQGVITGIDINVSEMTDSEAPVVTQTLTIDRYKGD